MSEALHGDQRPLRLVRTIERKHPLRPTILGREREMKNVSRSGDEISPAIVAEHDTEETTGGLGFAIGHHLLMHHKRQRPDVRLSFANHGDDITASENNPYVDTENVVFNPFFSAGTVPSQNILEAHTDWEFLQKTPAFTRYSAHSDCPSLVSGSTMSSRNSSTRSTKSFRWDAVEDNEKGICPLPDCGRAFKDLAAHMLTHQAERPEKCPVESCDYHVKGFARPYDRLRHTLCHFRRTLPCGFCPETGSNSQKTFSRVDVFLRHLTSAHGADARRQGLYRTNAVGRPATPAVRQCPPPSPAEKHHVSNCTLCAEPFDAQGFYDHLPGCVLRQVTRSVETQYREEPAQSRDSPRNDSVVTPGDTAPLTTPSTERSESVSEHSLPDASDFEDNVARRPNAGCPSSESKEIAELTASSRCLSLTSSRAIESSDEETDWTEDAGSRESTPDAPSPVQRRLSPIKRQLVDNVMHEFHRLFDQSLRTHGCGGSSNSSSSHGYSGASSSGSSIYSSSSFISRKRSLSGGGSPPPNNDGDDPHKRRRPDAGGGAGGKQVPPPELRFACPYYKRNPGRHQTFTSCRDPGFVTVARLKEHLYRRHLLPPQCNRCCATFTNDIFLREHQRDARGCEVRESIPLEGFDKDQERRLKSKKRSLVYQSEEDKWKGVYRILFPDDNEVDMPSPYIEYQPCNGGQAEPTNESDISRFHDFSRLELPRLVRRTLEVVVEQEAQPLEDKLKDQLVDIVKQCQNQLISMFQATGSSSSDASQAQAAPGPSQQPAPPMNTLPNVPFNGFDSIQIPVSGDFAMPTHPYSQQLQEHVRNHEAQKPDASPMDRTSGSPDSGYDSTWTGAAAANVQQDVTTLAHVPTFAQMEGFGENEYADLGGYYGLFENRHVQYNPAAPMDPSAWTFPQHATAISIPVHHEAYDHAGGAAMYQM